VGRKGAGGVRDRLVNSEGGWGGAVGWGRTGDRGSLGVEGG